MAKARMDGLVEMVERVKGETRQRGGRPVAVAEPRGTMHVGRVFDASREPRGSLVRSLVRSTILDYLMFTS